MEAALVTEPINTVVLAHFLFIGAEIELHGTGSHFQ
jgi:hypothetical protein